MTRQDLAKMVSVKAGIKVKDARIAVDTVFNVLATNLKAKEPVLISGVGMFNIRHMKERSSRNPLTGKIETVPAHDRIVFTPSRAIRNAVK